MGNRMGRATALLRKLLSLLLDISAPLVAEGSKKYLDVIIRGAYLIRSHIFGFGNGEEEMARFCCTRARINFQKFVLILCALHIQDFNIAPISPYRPFFLFFMISMLTFIPALLSLGKLPRINIRSSA